MKVRARTDMAAMRGTELHEFASTAIRLGERLQAKQKTLNLYVRDAIGFGMTPEVILFYSYNAFGSADCISFRQNKLRIHDLKTGVSRASVNQLEIYAALFCLEYKIRPGEIEIELRIYQEDEITIYVPTVEDIAHIMDRIVAFDKIIEQIREEDL